MRFTAIFLTIFLFLVQYIHAQLTSESVAVRPCYRRNPYAQGNALFVYNPSNVWYVNYGSPHLFRSYAEVFLGYSPRNQQELDALNFRVTLTGVLISNWGYGSGFFQQICDPLLGTLSSILGGEGLKALFKANCTTIPTTAKNNNEFLETISPSEDTLLWTDNSNVLVISRCVGSGPAQSEDWKILSKTPTIDQNLFSAILRNLTMGGFDTSNYQHLL